MKLHIFVYLCFSFLFAVKIIGGETEDYKVKRESDFSFEKEPVLEKLDNRYKILFKVKSFCDVTVRVVSENGKIVRHLCSGLLGENAPEPFIKKSLQQEIFWDLKDDSGNYVVLTDAFQIQVCLGLKPQYERSLYWEPQRKLSSETPVIKASKQGILIYNGSGVDHLYLYDHDGKYLRTIYPFASDKAKNITDLEWIQLPSGGNTIAKKSFLMQTLLTSGDNAPDVKNWAEKANAMHGNAAVCLGVFEDQVAIIKKSLNRLSFFVNDKKFNLQGPDVTQYTAVNPNSPFYGPPIGFIYPKSAAFSPDGKWLYLAGYYHKIGDARGTADYGCLHGITRMQYDLNEPPSVFKGKMTSKSTRENNQKDAGTDNESFNCATSVAVDKAGRVYVSDYMNHRIQVFAEDGKYLKSINCKYPAKLFLHPVTEEIYVASFLVYNSKLSWEETKEFKPTIQLFGSFDKPDLKQTYNAPFLKSGGAGQGSSLRGGLEGAEVQVEFDFWSEKLRIWCSVAYSTKPMNNDLNIVSTEGVAPSIYELDQNQWKLIFNFENQIKERLGHLRSAPKFSQVQNLYVNQKTGFLYIGEPDSIQNFSNLIEVNPNTGICKNITLPFQTVDLAFDNNGFINLRKVDFLARYEIETWKEIPFDYGIEVRFTDENRKSVQLISCLPIPSVGTNQSFQGGMDITATGKIIISCVNEGDTPNPIGKVTQQNYKAPLFPGRPKSEAIHIWDQHGKVLFKDVLPGIGRVDSVRMDLRNNVYIMSVYHRLLPNKIKFPNNTSTIAKFSNLDSKTISDSKREDMVPITYPANKQPDRAADLYGLGNLYVDKADWFYGGVGFSGKHFGGDAPIGCCCWHSSFALDGYGRSFAPEVNQYSVAVIDTNGNLILKVGKFGNCDDGIPIMKDGKSPGFNDIGGDQVSFFYPGFTAVDSDQRLFVSDIGNGRVVSVKLGYHLINSIKVK